MTLVGLDGSPPSRLSGIPTSEGATGVSRLQLADQLLADLSVRPAGDPDRGPWPTSWRVAGAVAGGLGGRLATATVPCVSRRLRRLPA